MNDLVYFLVPNFKIFASVFMFPLSIGIYIFFNFTKIKRRNEILHVQSRWRTRLYYRVEAGIYTKPSLKKKKNEKKN